MTRFRPCIDLRHGQVTQIVGSSLGSSSETTNWTSDGASAADFAAKYRNDGLKGGHIIALGGSPANQVAIMAALQEFPSGMQVGGGVNAANARKYLEAGASHVIVTSYVFEDGELTQKRLQDMVEAVGRKNLVLDLSCRRKSVSDGTYHVVSNRWQRYTECTIAPETLENLGNFCDEFLVHGVDVEGKRQGIEKALVPLLANSPIPVTYAGGVRSLDDLNCIKTLSQGRVDASVGSALDIFGGDLLYQDVLEWSRNNDALDTADTEE